MSVKVMTHVWENSKQTGNALLVLLALADAANQDGECYPGITRIAQYARITERSTQRILKKLAKDKEIIIKRGSGAKTKTGNTNLYIIPFNGVTPESPVVNKGVTVASPRKGRGVTPESPQGVTPESPKPSVEPSVKKEPSVNVATSATQDIDDSFMSLNPVATQQLNEILVKTGAEPLIASAKAKKGIKAKSDQYQRLFNGVALVSYEIDFSKLSGRKIAPSTLKRIGLVASWLDDNKNTPEQLWQFSQWYKAEYPSAAMPCDLGKFQRHWLKWEQSKSITHSVSTIAQGNPPQPSLSALINTEALVMREREKIRLAKEQVK